MQNVEILDVPTDLGLAPTGVHALGAALQAAGLGRSLSAAHAGTVETLPYNDQRDDKTGLLNPERLREVALRQAEAVGALLDRGAFPLVLGGDDSVLFGNLLALRRRGRYGLAFLDGHTDFYLPEQSTTGQASDCDLALGTGRGPDVIANLGNLRPLARDEDVAALGARDSGEREELGSPDAGATAMLVLELDEMHRLGPREATGRAVRHISNGGVEGFWIHLDTDVIDDAANFAVDYRLPGGLSVDDVGEALHILVQSSEVIGMDVTIYNPALDSDGTAARAIIEVLVAGLRSV